MKIIYVSSLCSKDQFKKMFELSQGTLGQQAQKYHKLLAEGFSKNEGKEVHTITSLPLIKSSRKIYIKGKSEQENGINYNYITLINIPIIKHLVTILLSFFKTMQLCYKDKNSVVICDILNVSVSIGALIAAKVLNRENVGIVTDIPNLLFKNSKKLSVKINNYLMNSFSSYVFLTKYMKDIIKCDDKKYVVIEGHVDSNMRDFLNELNDKYDNKVCIYAGGLQKIYGIKYLTEAFIEANIENAELHIYGTGDFEDDLKNISNMHKNIKYLGVKPNDMIIKEEIKATLLINPRPTNEEYTKYSFPSKNMEYMASGTPVLTTMLPGMPKEYSKHVYIIEEESIEGLKLILSDVLNKSKEELYKKGSEAKQFVLEHKNNIIQAKKIIDMIEVKNG